MLNASPIFGLIALIVLLTKWIVTEEEPEISFRNLFRVLKNILLIFFDEVIKYFCNQDLFIF